MRNPRSAGFVGVQPRDRGFQVHVTTQKKQCNLVHTRTPKEGATWYAKWQLNVSSADPLSLTDFQQHHRLPVQKRKQSTALDAAEGIATAVAESDDGSNAIVPIGDPRDLAASPTKIKKRRLTDDPVAGVETMECSRCGARKRVLGSCGHCSHGKSRRFFAHGAAAAAADWRVANGAVAPSPLGEQPRDHVDKIMGQARAAPDTHSHTHRPRPALHVSTRPVIANTRSEEREAREAC